MKKIAMVLFIVSVVVSQIKAQDFWQEIQRPINGRVFSMVATSLQTGYLGMGNGVYLSNNDNYEWTFHGLENTTVYSLYIDPNGIVLAGTGGTHSIYMFSEYENNWVPIFTSVPNVVTISSDFEGSIYANNYGIIKTSDYGNNWEQIFNLDGSQWVTDILCIEQGVIYAGIISFIIDAGGVYRSFDYGETWDYAGLSGYFIKTLANDSQGNVYAGSVGNFGIGIYRSQDQGLTWTALKNDVFVESIVITPEDHIYIGCSNEHGSQGGVFVSTDYGENWEMINSGLNNENVYGLCYSPDGYLYAYGDHLHRSQTPVFSEIETQINNSEEFLVYPNPNTGSFTVHFYSDSNDNKIKIFNTLGQEVETRKINEIGEQTVVFEGFAKGQYTITFFANNKLVKSIKLIVK
jgi:hypothetical protein